MAQYEDYSLQEIDAVCKELLEEHRDKLKSVEIGFITLCKSENEKGNIISDNNRLILVGMYDRLRGEE